MKTDTPAASEAGARSERQRTPAEVPGVKRGRRTAPAARVSDGKGRPGAVRDTILVLDASPSKLRFTEFAVGNSDVLAVRVRGWIDELYGQARFRALNHMGRLLAEHKWGDAPAPRHEGAIAYLFDWLKHNVAGSNLMAIGHRVVHGTANCPSAARLDHGLIESLGSMAALAPQQQSHNLAPIREIALQRPALLQVACFDIAFHSGIPLVAQSYALPDWVTRRGVRRYGLHGFVHESVAAALPGVDGRAAAGRTLVLNLGDSVSLCALRAGKSVASSPGFSTSDGLPTATQAGRVDAGAILYCMRELAMDAAAVEALLCKQSGLLALSGRSGDLRELVANGDPRARFAVEYFVYQTNREMGALVAELGGLDAIVFTGAIGEDCPEVRALLCEAARWLGIELDPDANAAGGPRISAPSSRVSAWVVPADPDRMVALHTLRAMRLAQ